MSGVIKSLIISIFSILVIYLDLLLVKLMIAFSRGRGA